MPAPIVRESVHTFISRRNKLSLTLYAVAISDQIIAQMLAEHADDIVAI